MSAVNERFFDKVDKTHYCWNWMAGCFASGYGQFTVKKYNNVRAHRLSWEIRNGPIPEGGLILHKCHNRKCVNPDHLYVGTAQDNRNDMTKDGTVMKGENHPCAKLTERNVRTIKWLLSLGVKQVDLTVIYGVKKSIISRINVGIAWSHI